MRRAVDDGALPPRSSPGTGVLSSSAASGLVFARASGMLAGSSSHTLPITSSFTGGAPQSAAHSIRNSRCDHHEKKLKKPDRTLSKTTFAPVSSVSCGMSSMATADPEASFRLGLMYEHGSGELESDPEAAAAHYEQAAVQGHPEAQVQLGLFYASGLGGLQQDDFRAAELYTSAANLGSALVA
mgnify:CR=1 FL=1